MCLHLCVAFVDIHLRMIAMIFQTETSESTIAFVVTFLLLTVHIITNNNRMCSLLFRRRRADIIEGNVVFRKYQSE